MQQLKLMTQKKQGFTLAEVMVIIAIIGILAAIAVPSYQDMIERNRLKQAAESLADDLKFARTEAIKRSNNVTLAFAGTCYGISPGDTACVCSTAGSCTIKTVDAGQFTGITLAGNNVTFSFLRGTTTSDADITSIVSSSHYQASVITENVGKVLICTTGGVMGYPIC